jgi:hypothetical protein
MESKTKLDDYITFDDHIGSQETITLSPAADTITLSSNIWDTSTITGAYSYPNTVTMTGSYPNVTLGSGTGISNPWTTTSSKIKLDGEGADIEVNGESLIAMIKRVEERLNILTPNEKLEEEWEELRALGNRYRELEQHIKDKQATWDRLKAMPPPNIE